MRLVGRRTHLFQSSYDEPKNSEDVEVWWSRSHAADNRLNNKRRHERLLSTKLVRQKPEQYRAEHYAEVEYHLRSFGQHVSFADKIPLTQNTMYKLDATHVVHINWLASLQLIVFVN